MSETTYLPEVCVIISEGLRADDITVELSDEKGRKQFLHVTRNMVNHADGVDYLPIGFVDIDRRGRRVLIELPVEADSGANRIWVKFDALRQETGALA
jgi:hypothetical protein